MIIGLFGLSGSGKSSLRKEFEKSYPHFYCTSASELLKQTNRPILPKNLNISELDTNQNFLIEKIKNLVSIHENIFIELHAVIEDKYGNPYIVNESILKSLNLNYIFILDIPASQILNQRIHDKMKNRPLISIDKIIKLSALQKKYLNQVFPNQVRLVKNLSDIENIITT